MAHAAPVHQHKIVPVTYRRIASVARWTIHPMWFPTVALILLAGAIFHVTLGLTSIQPDTWWALRAGQDMWHSHRPMRTDQYSYTAFGRPWPDHAWGYQVLLYGLYRIGRLPLITLVHALLATGAIVGVRPRGRVTWVDIASMTPVIALVSLGLSVRPQVLSLSLIVVMMHLIQRERWRTIVALMLLWANLHGEVVIGGLLLVAATAAAVVAWLIGHRDGDIAQNQRRLRRLGAYAVTTAASALVTLINPMGWGLWHYLATANSRPGQNLIAEWRPSWSAPAVTAWFWIWCAVLAVAIVFRIQRLRRWPVLLDLCMTAAVAPLAWLAIRNIGVFGVVSLPLLIGLLRRDRGAGSEGPGSILPGGRILAAAAVLAAAVSSTTTLDHPEHLNWNPMPDSVRSAIDACPGNVYTTYNSGAYLTWFTPQKKDFVDNRQDPFDAATMDLGMIDPSTPSAKLSATFTRYDIKCAAVTASTDSPTTIRLVLARWQPIVASGDWIVLVDPTVSVTNRG